MMFHSMAVRPPCRVIILFTSKPIQNSIDEKSCLRSVFVPPAVFEEQISPLPLLILTSPLHASRLREQPWQRWRRRQPLGATGKERGESGGGTWPLRAVRVRCHGRDRLTSVSAGRFLGLGSATPRSVGQR